jgi:MinD-like ATPase involved in chromosome partitioning or flagellar assembly
MYTVTFYSFKGGVGRTMALVNTAVELAQRGHKILIVDFDLEAPGIATYPLLASSSETRGIVDYVTEYLEKNIAPEVSEFVTQCDIGGHELYVMSAGRRDAQYSTRLNSISWSNLYSAREGYLLFEDLKQQWQQHGYQYVLIDSRTGHTDVGGICTRQLPDAVVLMFFPNDQNLSGLATVTQEIRRELSEPYAPNITLHFCASNVPDIDDEDNILQRKIADARALLQCPGEPIVIHHYDSLSLLEQSIFVKDRPASKLANEYRKLVSKVISRNMQDRDGALLRLEEIQEDVRRDRTSESRSSIPSTLERIRKHHPRDAQIAWEMSRIYSIIGDFPSEVDALTLAIERDYLALPARRRRAALAMLQFRNDDAIEDLTFIVESPKARPFEFIPAVQLLRGLDPKWLEKVERSLPQQKLDIRETDTLARLLLSSHAGSPLALRLVREARSRDLGGELQNAAMLALIHSQQYEEALEVSRLTENSALQSTDVVLVFNVAMALWGRDGNPSKALFLHVIELMQDHLFRDANDQQCLALASYVVGEYEAAYEHLGRAVQSANRIRDRQFSCWEFLFLSRQEFEANLRDLKYQMDEREVLPAVFRSQTVH